MGKKKMRKREEKRLSTRGKKKDIQTAGTPLENRQHEAFCQLYAKNLNKVDSYLEAYQSDANPINHQGASSSATRILKDIKVQTRINELADHTAKDLQISKYRILEDIQNEIAIDPFDALEWTASGNLVLRDVKDIPIEVRKTIKSLKQNKNGQIEVSFYDKQRAREMLMKHLGMLSERIDLHVTHDLGDKLAAAHQRVIKRSGGIDSPEGIETAEFEEID